MANPVVPSSGALSPLGLSGVRLSPGFWGSQPTQTIIDHCYEWMDRVGWIANFGGGPRRGREFSDSEVYKLMEAMAWAGDPRVEELTRVVARAQELDGYLNTRWPTARYTDLEWGHELYCYGHLIQAGVARMRVHGEDQLSEVVCRAADHVCARFMEGNEVCGHPEIEMALVELYRQTGAERYLEMARRFVERRGGPALADIELGRAYFQDDVSVRQAEVLRGHVVRALYLSCAVVDLAVEMGDKELLETAEGQWERTVARRTSLTGGMGSRHSGESFGDDYELPPDRAYNETCAGVASVMLAHRLLLATGDPRYADQIERTLYNVVAAGPALDGHSFFYTNPLQVRVAGEVVEGVSPRAEGGLRAPWREVSCCPTNIARTFASLPAYVATGDDQGIQVHQITAATISHDGLSLRMDTDYPWSGKVTLRVEAAPEAPRRITMRTPAWAGGGTHEWERSWRPGEEIRVDLPMAPRWVRPDPRIDAVRGCVAVERGPLVYCAESPGDAPPLSEIEVSTATEPVERGADLEVEAHRITTEPDGWPYGGPASGVGERLPLSLIPYYRWGNRGPATMRVWLPETR
ncbi:glycoside hydrolase family 127 protein [Sphaerisporangium flaviroseum]|uniref:Glycoside hydrolase family 127 protein n=1 Tax=Sphaerisporangium flaviroseum TaxID=509199 RepID=A0ABP7HD35_9ACTN